MGVISFIQKLMQEPSLFLGLIALVGFLILRERIERTIAGTLKTALGLLILLSGTGLMVTAPDASGGYCRESPGLAAGQDRYRRQ
jgi:PTS system ascorbate-specific IIC component